MLLLTYTQLAFSQQREFDSVINEFIKEVKENNAEKIAENISYPQYREYPLPPINSEKELISRYHQIFDDSLRQIIMASNINQDWREMGWRGIMLNNGVLWLDRDGKLISVNYQSSMEKKEWEKLVEADKSKLYPSLKKFVSPILYMKTKGSQIRIDQLGSDDYRFVSWSPGQSQSDKPALVLTNGKIQMDGSGGNRKYIFTKGSHTYICYVLLMGEDTSPPGGIEILKNNQEISKENALARSGY